MLERFFTLYTGIDQSKEKPLRVGTICLMECPALCASFLSFVAEQQQGKETGFSEDGNKEKSVFPEDNFFHFPSLQQWQRFLKSEFKTPRKPDRDDPYLYPHLEYAGRDDLEARAYRAYRYVRAEDKWREESHEASTKNEKQRRIKAKYGNDQLGYCRYVFDRLDEQSQEFLLQPRPFEIAESQRERHTYISGGTGSGKSEKLKALIHHYLTVNTQTAIVLIDPHGKIAEEVARFPENYTNDRLVFIAPDFDLTKSPVFNPFEFSNSATPQGLDIAVQELMGAFREILTEGMEFSPQMETLLKPCITALLQYPEGNLYHLQQMMDEQEAKPFLEFADTVLTNPVQKNFLKTDFLKKVYRPSRQSIRTKIQSLLNSQIFLNFVIGKSTFSLAECIHQKKLVIFSLSRNTGAETSDTIGRLILANLQSLAMQRAALTRKELENVPPIHAFIDECQHYVTPSIETILTETRKYKLHLTLANQFLDQIDDRRIKNAIKGNTAVKITGRQTEPSTLESIARITGTPADEIRNLNTGQYHIKAGTLESAKVSGYTNLLDVSHSMTAQEWEQVRERQLERYYREVSEDSIFSSPVVQGNKDFEEKDLE